MYPGLDDPSLQSIGVGRGGGGRGEGNNLRVGGQHTLCSPHPSPNNPSTFSFNFYVKQEKITNVPS